jgi:hypothetical protein
MRPLESALTTLCCDEINVKLDVATVVAGARARGVDDTPPLAGVIFIIFVSTQRQFGFTETP